MGRLPVGWLNTRLGEVVEYAKTIKTEPSVIKGNEWVLELEDIEKKSSKLLKRLSYSDRKSKSTKNRFLTGDVLYGKLRPYLDKIIIADQDGYCSTEIIPITPNAFLNGRYLFYSLKRKEFLNYVDKISHGLNMPRLGTKQGQLAPFILSPLNEQIRIANKLDSLLAKVEAAQTRLDKIPTLLKRFRQSVLAAATSGELTKEWREENIVAKLYKNNILDTNIIERKKLINSKAKKAKTFVIQELIDLPENWIWLSIDQISLKITDGTHHSPKSFSQGEYMYITSKNVREGYMKMSSVTFVDQTTHHEIYSRCDVVKGDVLYVKDGAKTGLACVNPIEEEISLLSSVGVIKPASYILAKYIEFYLNSPTGRGLMLKKMTGNAIKRLTIKKIMESPISLPPIEEQKQIVKQVESLFTLADQVEKQYQQARQRTDKLSQSLLAKAFKGELVPQDPNDEPAEKLLARILEERETLKPAKKSRKAK